MPNVENEQEYAEMVTDRGGDPATTVAWKVEWDSEYEPDVLCPECFRGDSAWGDTQTPLAADQLPAETCSNCGTDLVPTLAEGEGSAPA